MRFSKLLLLAFLFGSILTFNACKDDTVDQPTAITGKKTNEFSGNILQIWCDHSLKMIQTTNGYTPPVAARNLGYIGITAYEAVQVGTSDYQSLAGQLNGLTTLPKPEYGKEYYMPACANAAMAKIHTLLFPLPDAKQAKFDSIAVIKSYYDGKFKSEGVSQEVLDRSNGFGEAMALAVFNWSSTDFIGHEAFRKNFPTSYTAPKGEGLWVPTSSQLIPLQPYWGSARCFVSHSVDNAQPIAPPTFSKTTTSDFYKYANQVYTTSKNLTASQKLIGLFWADGGGTITPPGHSIAIAKQLAQEKGLTLDKTAELFARMGIAVGDAFMACWKCKYTYNLIRPESYIQQNIDPAWKPLIATPPFPEYISGHSTQAGAAGFVLSSFFGSNFAFEDKTHANRTDIDGKPRKFNNFMEMAEEAAISRLYGGIHYEFANNNGLNSGLKIGKALDQVQFKK